jgi:hypothetical protein
MKHATDKALERLSDLLDRIRAKDGIREKKTGVFYRGSKAFLHFHEDPAGMFADLRVGEEFERLPVNTAEEQKVFLSAIDRTLSHAPARERRD